MNVYLALRKVVQVVSLVLLMAVVLYVIFRLLPGDPAEIFLLSTRNAQVSHAELRDFEAQLGLSGGKWDLGNFWIYLRDMFTFQFGYDYYRSAPVGTLLEQALPFTLLLVGTASVASYVLGIPLGIVATWQRGRRSETALVTTGLLLTSVPYFVLAILIFLYVVVALHAGDVRAVFPLQDLGQPTWAHLATVGTALALPVATLAAIGGGAHLLTMRAAMVSVLGEDYILTARAKGVRDGAIMFRHAARNAMIPVSTRMALDFALVMSGAVITEIVFSYPGIGNLIFTAIQDLDYPLAEGALFVISLVVILTYSALDFVHALIDPRLRV